jgi:hypothetical protein
MSNVTVLNQPQARKPKFKFNSNSAQPRVTPILREALTTPRVFYTPQAKAIIDYIVAENTGEIGWLGLVDTIGHDFMVTDILIPRQTVSATQTDISTNAMTDLAMELMDKGLDPGKMIYWGHSHVNMGVTPSGQDESQVEEYLENCPVFIRGIYNKRGESKVDVYNLTQNVVFECVWNGVEQFQLPLATRQALDAHMNANIIKTVYNNYNHNNYNGHNHNNSKKSLSATNPNNDFSDLGIRGSFSLDDRDMYTDEEWELLNSPFATL